MNKETKEDHFKYLLVTLADESHTEQAKQVFSSAYFNAGWDGDYMLLAHAIPEEKLKWFRDKKILVKKCEPLYRTMMGGMSPALTSKFYLFTPEFKKWKTVVYVDADTTLMASLNRLKNIAGFASVDDGVLSTLKRQITLPEECGSRGISPEEYKTTLAKLEEKYDLKKKCFCAGFFVFNPNDCIRAETFLNLTKLHRDSEKFNRYGEQLAWNLFFYKKWKKLPSVYNFCPIEEQHQYRMKPGSFKAIVLHYKGVDKPWDDREIHGYYQDLWQKNLRDAEKIDLGIKKTGREWTRAQIFTATCYLTFRASFFGIIICGIDRSLGKMGQRIKKTNPGLYFFLKELQSPEVLCRPFHCMDRAMGRFGIYLMKKHPDFFKKIEKNSYLS